MVETPLVDIDQRTTIQQKRQSWALKETAVMSFIGINKPTSLGGLPIIKTRRCNAVSKRRTTGVSRTTIVTARAFSSREKESEKRYCIDRQTSFEDW